jgi:hypothetical protein
MSDLHFEALRADLEALDVPQGQARRMRWLAVPLAVGRTPSGDFEIFIRGAEIHASSPLVRRHLQYGEWRAEGGGDPFSASRIVLPAAPHFASVAALIAIELLRAGITGAHGPQPAFYDVEPIIEMAIRRGALAENVVIGLIGELTVLRQLLLTRSDRPAEMMRVLEYWQGWQEGGRDFRIRDCTIEVKTTQASVSSHEFSGLHQLEPALLPSGGREQLHLLSVGLVASTTVGESLPGIIDSLIRLLGTASSPEVVDEMLRRVSLYGSQSGCGYSHGAMQDWGVYGIRYAHSFPPRLYRVDDPGMRLLDRDLLSRTFVQPEGLAFTMHLPEQVSPFNPAPSWEAEVEAMTQG